MKVVDDSTLEGYRYSTGWARDQKVYFVMKFSKPFAKSALISEKIAGKSQIGRAELQYATAEGEQIVVKTALSMHSLSGAYRNMQEEAPHFAFDTYREAARALWEKQLQKITVTSDDEQQKTIFYTMLYQTMLAPNLYSDVKEPVRYDTCLLYTSPSPRD